MANIKLTQEQIEAIKNEFTNGTIQNVLSTKYDVHINTIKNICKGITQRSQNVLSTVSTLKAEHADYNTANINFLDSNDDIYKVTKLDGSTTNMNIHDVAILVFGDNYNQFSEGYIIKKLKDNNGIAKIRTITIESTVKSSNKSLEERIIELEQLTKRQSELINLLLDENRIYSITRL